VKKIKNLKIIYKGEDKYIERVFEDGSWDEIPAAPKVQARRPRKAVRRVGMNRTRQKQF
jgi:hypothetical protein